MVEIDKIIAQIEYLPPFPAIISKALKRLKEPDVSTDEIAEIIRFDQATASNVLRMCNSSYFGLRRTLSNISEAVVYIGLSRLKQILLLTGFNQYFDSKPIGYESKKGELWKHTLSTAIIAENARKIFGVKKDENIFISGLIHDVGKLVLGEFVAEAIQEIHTLIEKKGLTFIDAEKSVFSIDHAELGSKVIELWKFPEEVINAVKKHHTQPEEGDNDLDNIIRISDSVSMKMGFGTTIDGDAYEVFSEICELYGMKYNTFLEKVMEESLEEIQKIESEYGGA
ncbi:HDOD domain-containing protein [Candidatus Latescibacterota bacterium]